MHGSWNDAHDVWTTADQHFRIRRVAGPARGIGQDPKAWAVEHDGRTVGKSPSFLAARIAINTGAAD